MRKLICFLALASCAAFGQTFNFTFSGTGISASGTFTTSLVSGNEYLVTAISGTYNGSAMTLLAPNAYEGNTNWIFSTSPYLSYQGLGFSVNGADYNAWSNNGSDCLWSAAGSCAAITVTLGQPPAISLTPSPTTGDVTTNFTFTVACSTCVGYIWSFGDGTYTAGEQTSQTHSYGTPGNYTATVYSVNATGNPLSANATVSVTGATVQLNWNASTSQVIGYNVYRGTVNNGPYPAKLTNTPTANLSFADNTVVSGTTYYYVTTAVDSSGRESGYSNQASAVIP